MNKKLLVSVLGPTAIGKTNVTIELAKFFNSEIISCDSRQFYKELSIGTAVPSKEELSQVTHHFIQNKSIHESYTVGDYEIEAKKTLENIFKTNDIAFLTGGSGLFEKALTIGLDDFPEISSEIREELNQLFIKEGISSLQKMLQEKDPIYFNIIDKQNHRRLIRALEVCISTNSPYSSHLKKNLKKESSFNNIKIGLTIPREQLYQQINNRVDTMMENGLLEEAKQNYFFKHLNALQTVGYKELFSFLDQELTLNEAINEIKKNTRRYAKRQLTWYRKDEEVNWFNPSEINRIKNIITEYKEI
ncbi:MAG: tRNA (adenosine(37)-N6)-dimethylallyltransferase MiaA [Solirubrobacteraceae bacterium]